jgi:hypothetical protein
MRYPDARPIPLRPDRGAVQERGMRMLVRSCLAHALASIEQTDAGKVVRRVWPQDEQTAWLTRAASAPETLSSASPLVELVVADLIAALTPTSAAARLLEAGLQLSFNGAGIICRPSRQPPAMPASSAKAVRSRFCRASIPRRRWCRKSLPVSW